jgi:acetate kinase
MEEKLMDSLDIVAFLKSQVEFFKDFPDDRLKELVQGSHVTTFEPNEAIIACGEEGRFMGIILDGTAEASVTDDSGAKHQISLMETSDIFGEISLMTGDRTVADVIGVTRCKALLIPQDLFSRILITHPPAIRYLSKTISERLRVFARERTMLDLAASAFRRSDDPYGLGLKTDEPEVLLVINCGSSSLKYSLFNTLDETKNVRGIVERIGQDGTRHACWLPGGEVTRELSRGGHKEAFAAMVEALTAERTGVVDSPYAITAVGHRVVHGGDEFTNSVLISDEVIKEIEKVSELAPLHNPVNLVGINEAQRCFPVAHHVAVFDTSFHHTLPPYAYLYGLPYKYYEQHRIRRYGFHGMSHLYASLKAAQFLKRPFNELRIISCHLGNGASMCAVDHGRSIDTTMGLTPTQGLLMGTRCGDVDPAALIHLMRTEGLSPDDLDAIINRESGLLGLSGVSNDMRDIEKAAQEGHHRALLAFKTFCYQIRKYIGAYVAAMQGLDVVIFTGGIGQGSAGVRSLACQGLGYMGIHIDERKNRSADGFREICDISADDAPVQVLVVPSDEERMIARETLRALRASNITDIIRSQKKAPVPIEVSTHHIHLSQEHVEALFGPGYQLTPELALSQPGQYACEEKVTLIGPKGRVERVRVLGPTRQETQVEISMTEQFRLGIHPPIRESGDLEHSPGIILEGPHGVVTTDDGVICALRHIHMSPEDALRFGLRDKYKVRVRVESARELVFGDVLIRVHPNYRLAMHIDTDEGNAANITGGMNGHIDGIQSRS